LRVDGWLDDAFSGAAATGISTQFYRIAAPCRLGVVDFDQSSQRSQR